MKGISASVIAVLAACLTFVVCPAAAQAQCRLCETPTYEPTTPLSQGGDIELSVETSLDFDQLVVLGVGSGTAALGPDGAQAMDGAVTAMSARAMVGTVTISGVPGKRLAISLPRRIELYSTEGDHLTLDGIEADLSDAPKLDSNGQLTFRFGGRLLVDGGLEGDFRGDVTISVDYL